MKPVAILIISIATTASAFAQDMTFITKDGHRYNQYQLDSLKGHGYFVGISNRRSETEGIVFSLTYYPKDEYRERGKYCGNAKNRLPMTKIKKLFPFNQTESIMLASFESDSRQMELPKTNGKVDISRLFEKKLLDPILSDQILDVLVNFKFDISYADSVDASIAMCYDPRNAILFLDKQGNVIGYVELCFECRGTKIEPDNMIIGFFCTEKFEIIKDIFRKAGVHYGVTYTEEIASFPGGFMAQTEYLASHLKYTDDTKGYSGLVWVEFDVMEDGSLADFEIQRGLCNACDKIAMDVVKGMPKWIPAMSPHEKRVKSHQYVLVKFSN